MFLKKLTSSNAKPDASAHKDDHHQTHVLALVLLVLTTLVVVFTALSMVGPQPANNPAANELQGESQQAATSQMQQASGTDGLPADIPIPDSASIVQNYQNDLTDNQSQRILVFQTTEAVDGNQLADNLQDWATESDFSITQRSRTNGSGTMITEKANAQLVISWSQTQDSTRVEINHVQM